jgi:hypothetical protein
MRLAIPGVRTPLRRARDEIVGQATRVRGAETPVGAAA